MKEEIKMKFNETQKYLRSITDVLKNIGIDYYYDDKLNFFWQIDDLVISVIFIDNENDVNNEYNKQIKCDDQIYFLENKNESNFWNYEKLIKLMKLKENIGNDIFFRKVLKGFFINNNIEKYIDNFYIKEKVKIIREKVSELEEKDEDNIQKLISEYFNKQFTKDKKYYYSADGNNAVLALESKIYSNSSYKYWYTYHSNQKNHLQKFKNSYILYYFKDKEDGVIINEKDFEKYLDLLNKTIKGNDYGWHVYIQEKDTEYYLRIPNKGIKNMKDFGTENETVEGSKNNIKEINIDNDTIKLTSSFKIIKAKH